MAKSKLDKYMKKRRRRGSFYLIISITVAAAAILLYILSLSGILAPLSDYLYALTGTQDFMKPALNQPLSVHFIDVGCGDSILICADDRNILIDTGKYSLSGKTAGYLRKAGIDHLDLFAATHTDSDHIGDFSSIAGSVKIDKVWINKFCEKPEKAQSEDEKLFYSAVKERNIPLEKPDTGIYDMGGFTLEVLSPDVKNKDENENSLVLRLKYGDVTFLFMGDAGKKTEKQLLSQGKELDSDILKAGHHGSGGGTTKEFLSAVTPAYTVISAGEENRYLPNRDCIDRIEEADSGILRTDNNGTVIIIYDGNKLSYITEKSR